MIEHEDGNLKQDHVTANDNFPDRLLYAFGMGVFVVIALLVWNHNSVHPGGWQDLAVGVGDVFILGGGVLYSFLWAVAALIKLVRYRRTSDADARTITRYGCGIAVHCTAILALFIAARCLLF